MVVVVHPFNPSTLELPADFFSLPPTPAGPRLACSLAGKLCESESRVNSRAVYTEKHCLGTLPMPKKEKNKKSHPLCFMTQSLLLELTKVVL